MNDSTPEEKGCQAPSGSPSKLDPQVLQVAINDAKAVRQAALKNAKDAIQEAFGDKYDKFVESKVVAELSGSKNVVQQKVSPSIEEDEGLTGEDLDEIVSELEQEITFEDAAKVDPVRSKNVEDTAKMIKNFREKVSKYPKHVSYEGSMVFCVLLSMNKVAHPSITNLPQIDQVLIRSLVPAGYFNDLDYFSLEFDDQKDFKLTFHNRQSGTKYDLVMFNSVIHPRPEDLKDLCSGVVPVEKDGERISVGGKITLNKRGIQKLIGVEPLKRDSKRTESEEDTLPRRQSVAGRNAYEIRADVLQMAIDWAQRPGIAMNEDEVMDLAKKFYQFVENRR